MRGVTQNRTESPHTTLMSISTIHISSHHSKTHHQITHTCVQFTQPTNNFSKRLRRVIPFLSQVKLRTTTSSKNGLNNRRNEVVLWEIVRIAFFSFRVCNTPSVDVETILAASTANKSCQTLAGKANAALTVVADHGEHRRLLLVEVTYSHNSVVT